MSFLKIHHKKSRPAIIELPWTEPVEWFKKIALPSYFFLDSAARGITNKNSRWSYLSISRPKITLKSHGDYVEIKNDERKEIIKTTSPLKILFELLENRSVPRFVDEIPFLGGAVGYISYEFSRHFEEVPNRKKINSGIPYYYFIVAEKFIAFDCIKKKAYLCVFSDKKTDIKKEKAETLKVLNKSGKIEDFAFKDVESNFDIKTFSKAVKIVKKYIEEGDLFQANIAQMWGGDFSGDSKAVYLNLRKINPSPYACYIKFPEVEIISCSPELLLRRRKNIVETRPIAGTRRRGLTSDEDKILAGELLLDAKERAEHIMLVDLERNDLGKISKFDTVKITENMVIEKYSHVSHIVSNVRGILKKNTSPYEIIKAVFPGGTITGCPKIRAIEIIDEIEPVERGAYCGSAGWISYNGDMDLNILIRTIVKLKNKVYFYAGAGIVADSIPEREYKETIHKANALAESLRCNI